jgi:hypothetical protein
MSFATFAPTYNPNISSQKTIQARLLRPDFGQGMTRASDDLNCYKRMATLSWDVMTASDANYIENFVQGLDWLNPFYYQLPDESTTRCWVTVPQSYKRTYNNGNGYYAIQIQIEEVFDIPPSTFYDAWTDYAAPYSLTGYS